MQEARSEAAPLPGINTVTTAAIGAALRGGFRDFLRAPLYGLFFSLIYVVGGWVIWSVYAASGQEWWLIPVIVGFPILAPFAAVGLYEVSRRLEQGERLDWRAVLGVVFAQKDRQVPSMAMVILLMFMFWVFVAHTIFALFMGLSAMTNVSSSFEILLQGNGPIMLLVGSVIGAGFAAVLFSVTVVGLPLILDHEVDFISAMILSVQSVLANIGPMIGWGVTIAVLVFIGMAPMFLGLFVVLPVLGHATWHMYRHLVG